MPAAKLHSMPGSRASWPPFAGPDVGKHKNEYLAATFSDAISIYLLSLFIDVDYYDLRERDYPLLAPPQMAERLRKVAELFPANPGYRVCRVLQTKKLDLFSRHQRGHPFLMIARRLDFMRNRRSQRFYRILGLLVWCYGRSASGLYLGQIQNGHRRLDRISKWPPSLWS